MSTKNHIEKKNIRYKMENKRKKETKQEKGFKYMDNKS